MNWLNPINWFKTSQINEELDQFKNINNEKDLKDSEKGEGIENIQQAIGGLISNNFVQKAPDTLSKLNKLKIYRNIAKNPEVEDAIEDAVIESTQADDHFNIFKLKIKDEELNKNKNTVKNLQNEFNEFIYNRLKLHTKISNYFEDFYIDGELYFENVIDEKNKSRGILYWKKLPTETMDYFYDYEQAKIAKFIQYKKLNVSKPSLLKDIKKDNDYIPFYPSQISYCNYGKFSPFDKSKTFGYLEKVIKPFNQLNMLETSVIIYRLVRAPERFVFTIDVGNMPRDKALRFVEKMKQKLSVKETFDPNTGILKKAVNAMSISDNFFLPTSSSGRGSNVSTVGGNASGFSELDDIYYFQKKLYKALKYPLSRIQNKQEGNSADNIFGGSNYGAIPRDEVKWSVFLENQQNKFCRMLLNTFLIHLEFKGFKKQYNLDETKIVISMPVPNSYKDQIKQEALNQRFENYNTLANNEEFSKYYLMQKYLDMSDEEIKANSEGFKKDKELGMKEEEI